MSPVTFVQAEVYGHAPLWDCASADDMHKTRTSMLSSICPRFLPPEPTDWSRVGLGGNGTNPRSGAFLTSKDRFRTTSGDYFSPLKYAPNQPVQRDLEGDAERASRIRGQQIAAKRERMSRMNRMIAERIRQAVGGQSFRGSSLDLRPNIG